MEYANVLENVYSEMIDLYNTLEIKEKFYNDMQQDFLHHIENDDFTEQEMVEIFLQLKKVRKERRKIKDERDLLVSLSTRIRPVEQLNRVIGIKVGIANREDKRINNWTYRERTNVFSSIIRPKAKECVALIIRPKYDFILINR